MNQLWTRVWLKLATCLLGGCLISRVEAVEEVGFTGQELALAMGAECPKLMESCDNCEAIAQDIRRS